MRLSLLFALGCSVPASLPVEQAAPPMMALSVTPVLPGHTLTLRVDGAQPGSTIFFLRGNRAGQGFCPPQLGGSCVDV
jgi:uncharacterized membrane protein YjjP (DUF1212 family)